MANETVITVVGNLTADPELKFLPSGVAVSNFTVASTPRTFDKQTGEWKDGDALFLSCSVWRQAAENVAETLRKGMRVIVQGRLHQRSYETQDGQRRTVIELEVEEVGPSLTFASAAVTRNQRGSNGQAPAQQQNYQQAPAQQQNYQQAPAQQNYQQAPAQQQTYQQAPAQNYQQAPAPANAVQAAQRPLAGAGASPWGSTPTDDF